MAKLENTPVKKSKAKKRKHTNSHGDEDEIANKSVIIEAQHVEEVPAENIVDTTKKAKKRKNKEKKGEVKEKRSKSLDQNENDSKHAADEEELQEPTLEQLKESEKPENNLAIVTIRQKKKQKHQKLVASQKGQSVEREKQKNEEYLQKWKNTRDNWKFEKLRQISIQHTMFELDKLSNDAWPLALEYLAGSKGAAKEKIVKIANDVIDQLDKESEEKDSEEERQELLNSIKYQRARDLLQIFD